MTDICLAELPPVRPDASGPVRARVKWFNVEKGFGFVTPVDGQAEAFLHASVLSRGGVARLGEGAELVCEIADAPKGRQVVRVIEVVVAEAPPEPELSLAGVVKWYQPDKGFGFVVAEDGDRDVFIHKSALKRSNLEAVAGGQRVLMAVVLNAKGREARALVVLPAE